ncbi:MAG: hemerythrin domain-containing protein [Acidobacteria bacterium]|nr:hemerythrin domain-containing protein [Acidobacteriota bacterium]
MKKDIGALRENRYQARPARPRLAFRIREGTMKPSLEKFRAHHARLRNHLDRFLEGLTQLDSWSSEAREAWATWARRLLTKDLLSHAASEEEHLYAVLDDLAGARGVRFTETMRWDHRILKEYIEEFVKNSQSLKDAEQLRGARLAGWQLYGLLNAHFVKEEAVFLPILEQRLTEGEIATLIGRMHQHEAAAQGK